METAPRNCRFLSLVVVELVLKKLAENDQRSARTYFLPIVEVSYQSLDMWEPVQCLPVTALTISLVFTRASLSLRGLAKGWFSRRVVLADVPPKRKPEQGYIRMVPRNENQNEGTVPSGREILNEGTFAKTTLLRNRPFVSCYSANNFTSVLLELHRVVLQI